ncbi:MULTISPECIES: non-ribosomal peptide synthetase [Bacillus]|uniref:non-ribosomal peptide synthetase n=1 Tax=Bacillus TaxID=1386 RepID=UPI0023DA91E3|nr:non-ribosomal peptide synthetase [Bacillus pseudomycoides]MDF2086159.1 amino acid adenylation domain-containing protein [Bacillus pseudomycoides]
MTVSVTYKGEKLTFDKMPTPDQIKRRYEEMYCLIKSYPKQNHYPLLPLQEQIWFFDKLNPGSTMYNIPFIYRLEGQLNLGALEQSLQFIVNRHAALRTTIKEYEGEPVQVIADFLELKCELIDMTKYKTEERKAKCDALIEEELSTGFDLEKGPLIRVKILKEKEDSYVLLINIHHIVFDGWSVNIFLQELSEVYRSYNEHKSLKLPDITTDFTDYVQWFNERINSGSLDNQRDYWFNELTGDLPSLELPTDFIRPREQIYKGDARELKFSSGLTQELHNLCKKNGVTMNMLLLSAVNLLLKRYTGQKDLIIGTPVAGRTRDEISNTIGYFVNTLPLRCNIEDDTSFVDLIKYVKEKSLQALDNQEYPFKLLVEQLNPERELGRSPIFQTIMTYADLSKTMELGDVKVKSMPVSVKTVKFDVGFGFTENIDGLKLAIDYRTDLYSSKTIGLLLKHMEQLLKSIVKNPTESIYQIPILSEKEKHELTIEVNQTTNPLPKELCVHQLFEKQAELHPLNVALKFEGHQVTYAELNARANKLAHWLQSRGIGANKIVVILCDQGIESIVSMLGVLKSGGAYIPLDPSYPVKRLNYMIEDSKASVVLTQSHLEHLLSDYAGEYFLLDQDWKSIEGESIDNLPTLINGNNLTNVLYTSGSTGVPKGVELPHVGVIRLVYKANFVNLNSSDVIPQLSPLNFDGATFEIWGALCNGSTLLIIKKEIVLAPKELCTNIYEHGVTTLLVTTPLLNRLIEDAPESLTPLRRVIFGGEIISKQHIKKALKYCKPGTLLHTYGPTENSFTSCYFPIHEVDEQVWTIPIGQPVSNTEIYILDHNLEPVPYGVVGEIYLSGLGLALGYLNDEERGGKVFIPHPFSKKPGARLYKTGDRARRLKNGNIEFISRNDNQVKIRSQRVELGEVESVLRKSTMVQECFVTVINNSDDGKRLAAYFVPKDTKKLHIDNKVNVIQWPKSKIKEVRDFLKSELPEYMVPSYLIPLTDLPLNINGKVNRHQLPSPTAETYFRGEYKEPKSEVEIKITEIWKRLLKVDRIGLEDNFFDLGGHSLLVVKVQTALKQELNVEIRIMDLFQYTTVSALSQLITQELPNEKVISLVNAPRKRLDEDTSIAIIGMSLRFPGANNPYEFWENLRNGKESISQISDEDLDPASFHKDPKLFNSIVRAGGFIDNALSFDPEFFRISEQEAKYMDPQHRIFLECAWEAAENAGYNLDTLDRPVSLYAGCATGTYLSQTSGDVSIADQFQKDLMSRSTFLTTRVSYKLNLTGESMLVDTACSTSLVSVHMACQSLILGQSDYALAGGISIRFPQKTGYLYEPNFILSPDGHCRAFDKDAAGTVEGNGGGVVLLKRLCDALEDGDSIYAIIKGSAINNDGNMKIGYTAPSLKGQADVIARAQAAANVSPDSISYIEAHGTGTKLGDPIEIEALTKVFRSQTNQKQFCGIGSVKTNIGHLGSAAGIAGLIKTTLALKYKEIPPSLHYMEPNPEIDFANSPFYVCSSKTPWGTNNKLRRAGVSSFGIGGTNVHVILEEVMSGKEEN